MRWLVLYVRCRRVPAAAGALLAGTAALWALSRLIAAPQPRVMLAALATLVGAAAIAPGLAGADQALDRTAAIAWPPRRAAHLLAATAAVAATVAATTLAGKPMADVAVIVRGAAGLGGLVGLSAVILGTGRAWPVPVGWTALVLGWGPQSGPWYRQVSTWMTQPAGTGWATVTAVALAATGTVAYALLGAADQDRLR
jgi:hypothetical protein